MQVFFVNGRFIKSQLLTAALEEGYRNQIMKGRFPGCVLAVTLPVTAVDVNVHPAKTQVKFAREHDVFDAVYHTVLDALDKTGAPAAVPAKEPPLAAASRQDFFQTWTPRRSARAAEGVRRPGPPGRRRGPRRLLRPPGTRSCAPPPRWRTAGRRRFIRPACRRARAPWAGHRPLRPCQPKDSRRPRPLRTGAPWGSPRLRGRGAAGPPDAAASGTAPKRGCPPAALRAGHPAGAAEADGGPAGPDCPEGESRPLAHRRGGAEHLHHL